MPNSAAHPGDWRGTHPWPLPIEGQRGACQPRVSQGLPTTGTWGILPWDPCRTSHNRPYSLQLPGPTRSEGSYEAGCSWLGLPWPLISQPPQPLQPGGSHEADCTGSAHHGSSPRSRRNHRARCSLGKAMAPAEAGSAHRGPLSPSRRSHWTRCNREEAMTSVAAGLTHHGPSSPSCHTTGPDAAWRELQRRLWLAWPTLGPCPPAITAARVSPASQLAGHSPTIQKSPRPRRRLGRRFPLRLGEAPAPPMRRVGKGPARPV